MLLQQLSLLLEQLRERAAFESGGVAPTWRCQIVGNDAGRRKQRKGWGAWGAERTRDGYYEEGDRFLLRRSALFWGAYVAFLSEEKRLLARSEAGAKGRRRTRNDRLCYHGPRELWSPLHVGKKADVATFFPQCGFGVRGRVRVRVKVSLTLALTKTLTLTLTLVHVLCWGLWLTRTVIPSR